MAGSRQTSQRLGSLDMLRGMAIAGMVLVNNPGSWSHMYGWLRHAGWSGCNLADLVFPFFLYAVGASLAFSLEAAAHSGALPGSIFVRILRRTVILFLTGVFLNAMPALLKAWLYGAALQPEELRIMGVLQRIALVYLAAGMSIVYLSERRLWLLTGLLFAGYWAVLALFPGKLSTANNPALPFDRFLLGASHLYGGGLDPEGLFSAVSAVTTALAGYSAGLFVKRSPHGAAMPLKLMGAAVLLLASGYGTSLWLPICKSLWTGPYVLVSAGWATLVLALCHVLAGAAVFRPLCQSLQILGRNALFFFVASAIVARILLAVTVVNHHDAVNLWFWLYDRLFASWLGQNEASSLLFAVVYLALWWLVLYRLDRKRWYFRV